MIKHFKNNVLGVDLRLNLNLFSYHCGHCLWIYNVHILCGERMNTLRCSFTTVLLSVGNAFKWSFDVLCVLNKINVILPQICFLSCLLNSSRWRQILIVVVDGSSPIVLDWLYCNRGTILFMTPYFELIFFFSQSNIVSITHMALVDLSHPEVQIYLFGGWWWIMSSDCMSLWQDNFGVSCRKSTLIVQFLIEAFDLTHS